MTNHLPNENCYWVEPGRLLAGEYPGAKKEDEARQKLQKCIACGVTFFLDLIGEGELGPYSHLLSNPALNGRKRLTHCRMPIRDVDRKSTRLNSSHLGISYAVFCLKKK